MAKEHDVADETWCLQGPISQTNLLLISLSGPRVACGKAETCNANGSGPLTEGSNTAEIPGL